MKTLLAIPIAVAAFLSSAIADQSVTLAWDANFEPDVSSYVIYYGPSSRTYTSSTNVGNVTTATVYGLEEGRTHYFAITAKNTSGLESNFSNEVTNAIPSNVTNMVPTISPIADVAIRQSGYTNLAFTVWDVETFPGDLMVAASSTNQSLLPLSGIKITGTNWNRFISVEPNPFVHGVTMVTVVVSDGAKASSTSFLVNVLQIPSEPAQFNFVSKVQVSDSPGGPWKNILTTILPVDMSSGSNKYYRTWLDLK